jgi:general nucleoside transport system permease protein
MDHELLVAFLAAMVRVATPLAFAALGETLVQRGGIINLGLEGAMLAGALGAALGAAGGGTLEGVFLGAFAGLVTSAVVAAAVVGARADQIITGTAVTLGAIGLTGVIARQRFGALGVGLDLPTLDPVAIPGLATIPIVGPAFFTQSLLTYLAYLMIPVVWWLLFLTRFGLELRATGESVDSTRAMGVQTGRVRVVSLLLGGALAGLAGATLVLAQVGTFTEKMTAGRGFIAIAIVVLGRWHPGGVALAALLFGGATALQFLFQASDTGVPYQLFLALPYLLALAALAVAVGRAKAPAGLGR